MGVGEAKNGPLDARGRMRRLQEHERRKRHRITPLTNPCSNVSWMGLQLTPDCFNFPKLRGLLDTIQSTLQHAAQESPLEIRAQAQTRYSRRTPSSSSRPGRLLQSSVRGPLRRPAEGPLAIMLDTASRLDARKS